ncbi:LAFE_0D08350g1_1 [Lachancea fermentati]|uniref:LAFE_0D08350g1_1 n=1 Tax=Lachancea fermentati TaxID=4955 RepID=A0A1G4MBP3_LACFM|nr:LAFE_0D08350g1_1 [Lachancea fermentati]
MSVHGGYYPTSKIASNWTQATNWSIQGVTLGGWLVTEPYITPSLYNQAIEIAGNETGPSIVDEYTLCSVLSKSTAKDLLSKHYKSWVKESDFKEIKEEGFNLVRIPIGYWAWKKGDDLYDFGFTNITYEDPYVADGLQLAYLNKAMEWSAKYGLKVWLDLHGAPASQNGFDNSGQRNLYGTPGWLSKEFTGELMFQLLQSVFHSVRDGEYGDNVVGIEVVNEPLGDKIGMEKVEYFYQMTFQMFEGILGRNESVSMVVHDAFQAAGYWDEYFNPEYSQELPGNFSYSHTSASYDSVVVDHHHYEVFSDGQLANSRDTRLEDILQYANGLGAEQPYHPAVVGEWSGAITDCATWVNGVGVGVRYDGSYYHTTRFNSSLATRPLGKCTSQLPIANWTEEYRVQVREFVEAQLLAYSNATDGWIFWNWKTESAPEWDYKQLAGAGLFPQPFDNYTFYFANGTRNPGGALPSRNAAHAVGACRALVAAAVALVVLYFT